MDLKKDFNRFRMATSAFPKFFWVRPSSEFGEHASNTDSSFKQRM